MYCAGRWEREFFDERPESIPDHEPTWLICLLLLMGPLFAAFISVSIAIHVEHMARFLRYLGG